MQNELLKNQAMELQEAIMNAMKENQKLMERLKELEVRQRCSIVLHKE